MAFSPVLFLLSSSPADTVWPVVWRICLAAASTLLCLACSLTLFRWPTLGKTFGAGAALTGYGAIAPRLVHSPFAALVGSIVLIFAGSLLFQIDVNKTGMRTSHGKRCLHRAQWGTWVVLATALIFAIFAPPENSIALYCLAGASCIAHGLFLHWALAIQSRWRAVSSVLSMTAIGCMLLFFSFQNTAISIAVSSMIFILLMPASLISIHSHGSLWWEGLISHPGRVLVTSFFFLCLAGSLCLYIPAATAKGAISYIDAVFTAVSAVCVTGLIVLDTPNDFSFSGQLFILIMIQLGGLGIMGIATVALHAMGRRLSLKQEKMLTSLTETSHRDLISSLATILKVAFILESAGAILLTLAFMDSGDGFAQALWRGVFTAVSAFCNAGFALQSDSLLSYQTNPIVLHTVASLIILGGMAPATSLLIPRWMARKTVPIPARIALTTTIVLLFAGTFIFLVFEWNGLLAGLSLPDKWQNAWFQSATLRTAGFNSVDIAGVASPSFLAMIFFMFVGGSPGGTAGGIKTTTIGILAMTFWANITNKSQIVTQSRRIHADTVYRAITVVIAGSAIWSLVVLMLDVTQSIPSRDLIFEATSAIGTVGLSTGATPLLDEIGKVIVIFAMFVGRIGPISLVMILNDHQSVSGSNHPEERISIT